MGYLSYYLLWLVVMRIGHHPLLALGLVLLFVLRPYLPDPWVWLRTSGRVRQLKQQALANPANVTARRDLARILIERGRPKQALTLLEQARKRAPEQADLLLLTGMAQLAAGRPEDALQPLGEAVEREPRIAFGEPYRLAGEALRKLERYDQAEEAFDHYLAHNSSSLEAWFRIYQLRGRQGRTQEARAALDELFSTWRQLPEAHRRKQWRWWARALPSRLLA